MPICNFPFDITRLNVLVYKKGYFGHSGIDVASKSSAPICAEGLNGNIVNLALCLEISSKFLTLALASLFSI